MKKIVLTLLAGIVAGTLCAQEAPGSGDGQNAPLSRKEMREKKRDEKRERLNELARQEEEGEIVYNKHSIFSVKLATDGYGIGYEFGKFKANRKSILFNFELS